jgi:hypothetical protein
MIQGRDAQSSIQRLVSFLLYGILAQPRIQIAGATPSSGQPRPAGTTVFTSKMFISKIINESNKTIDGPTRQPDRIPALYRLLGAE